MDFWFFIPVSFVSNKLELIIENDKPPLSKGLMIMSSERSIVILSVIRQVK